MTPAEIIGRYVRELRCARGLKIRECAHRMDWGESQWNRLEHGRAAPGLNTLVAVARALGVSVSDLVAVLDDPALSADLVMHGPIEVSR
jgi:transcriptional regulator with XRE-family HTH domain